MASAGLKAKVSTIEQRIGSRRATDPHEGHGWTSVEAVARWAHGDREGGLEFARAYMRAFRSQGDATLAAALQELVVVMTPDRPFAFDLLPRGLRNLITDERVKRVERIIMAPATPIDPYGAGPLVSYIQDDEATARCGYRVALTRERLDAAKAQWEEAVRKSHETCREYGVEPIDWSGAVDWEWYYAHAVPPHRPVVVSGSAFGLGRDARGRGGQGGVV